MSLKDKPNFADLRGQLVYRVADNMHGNSWQDFWMIAEVRVKSASDRMIVLERPLPGHGGTKFPPSALGHKFFIEKAEAVQHFVDKMRAEAKTYKRRIEVSVEGLAWAHKTCPSVDVDIHEISGVADRPATKEKARG